jgi:hypothetical protein
MVVMTTVRFKVLQAPWAAALVDRDEQIDSTLTARIVSKGERRD